MPNIRIWTLESDIDAKAVECLANKLVRHLELENLSIQTVGPQAVPKRNQRGASPSDILGMAVQNYLKQDDCVIFVIDSDGPMSAHQRRQESNSLINQITRVVENSRFNGKVFLVQAVQELEAWLLIDCLGIFCYFASKVAQYRENCRDRVSANQSFRRLVGSYQKGNTEKIVEAVTGGRGAKEYLIEFSKKILPALNPNKTLRNITREQYRENMSPEIAEYVLIDQQTLKCNNSLRKLGTVLAKFQ
ncbi:MAG: hypothetical protein F4W91_14650 [Gemmatimonadetes bacterium]|nr:hypothetical protein [Gemmatimonadota bacterium]